MDTYNLTIFNQSRIIVIVFLAPVALIGSFLLGLEFMPKNYFWVLTLPLLTILLGVLFYFAKQSLKIECKENTLSFEWKRKLFFNYSPIDPVSISEIETIVIDQNQLLKKIITTDREINISNGKLLMKDSQRFINKLRSIISQNNGRVIDSWDVWQEKGYLKWALRINTVIIVLITGILIIFGLVKGFDKIPPTSFFMLVFFLPQMLLYQKQMTNKNK